MNTNTALSQARRALSVGAVMAPLSKWCKKAIPRWIKRDKKKSKKVSDNDWSFKDRTLPWDDESAVSEEELWDGWNEIAMLDNVIIVDGEEEEGQDGFLRGTFLGWNGADIIDSAQFHDARHEESLFARDESRRYVDDDDANRYSNDALEEHLNNFLDGSVRESRWVDDGENVSGLDNDDDDSCYQDNIYDDLGIDDNDDASDEWTDDYEAVGACLDVFLEGRRAQ